MQHCILGGYCSTVRDVENLLTRSALSTTVAAAAKDFVTHVPTRDVPCQSEAGVVSRCGCATAATASHMTRKQVSEQVRVCDC